MYRVSLPNQGSNFLFFSLWLYSLCKEIAAASEETISFLLVRVHEVLLNTSIVKEENVFILANYRLNFFLTMKLGKRLQGKIITHPNQQSTVLNHS